MDGLAAALSMTYSEKETLSSRWFVYLSQLMKLFTLIAIGFVIITLPRAEAQGTVDAIWGARFDFYNQVPASMWIYGVLRLLVEFHSSWQALSWTNMMNDLEHQGCHTLNFHAGGVPDEVDHRLRTDSRTSILRQQAPTGTGTDIPVDESDVEAIFPEHDSHHAVQDTSLTEVNLHMIYQSWPGTVFSTFLEQFAFSISALLSAEIVVAQSNVKDALSWGQTAAIFTCAAGVLHWLYVQGKNVKKSGLLSWERFFSEDRLQYARATLSQIFRTGADKVRQFDYLRTESIAFIAEIECRDDDETTPLIRATKSCDYDKVQTLLSWPKTKPNLKDELRRTSLLWAAQSGDIRIVRRLLQLPGIDPNVQDNQGRTPLCWSVVQGHGIIALALIDHPSTNLDLQDKRGRTPLSWAAANGKENIISRLLKDKKRINPALADDIGWTPATWATVLGHHFLVERLLEPKGMKKLVDQTPSLRPKKKPYSLIGVAIPMLIANCPGAPQGTLIHLIKAAQSFKEHTRRRDTMLQSAAFCNDREFSEMLMRMGANVNGKIEQASPPLQWAAWHGNFPVAKVLLARKAIVDLCSRRQELAIDTAAKCDLGRVTQNHFMRSLTLKADSRINKVGYGTALYIAALNGDARMVRLLLDHGANMHERGEHGTPLHVAATLSNQEVVQVLVRKDNLFRPTRAALIRAKKKAGVEHASLILCGFATCLAMLHI